MKNKIYNHLFYYGNDSIIVRLDWLARDLGISEEELKSLLAELKKDGLIKGSFYQSEHLESGITADAIWVKIRKLK